MGKGRIRPKLPPANLKETISAFGLDPLTNEVFGATMSNSYSRCKNDKWYRFHERVTEWEQKEYLRYF